MAERTETESRKLLGRLRDAMASVSDPMPVGGAAAVAASRVPAGGDGDGDGDERPAKLQRVA